MSNFNIGFSYSLISTISFSLMAIGIHYLSGKISSGEILFHRSLFIVISLVFLAKKIKYVLNRDALPLWIRSLLGATTLSIFFFLAQKINPSNIIMINSISPILVLVFSYYLLGEKTNYKQILGVIIIIFAIIIFKYQSPNLKYSYFLLACLGSLCSALGFVFLKKSTTKFDSLYIVWFFSIITMFVSLAQYENNWFSSYTNYLPLLIICIFSLVGQVFLTLTYQSMNSSISNTLTKLSLFWTTALEIMFLGKTISIYQLGSYLLIFLGVIIIYSYKKI